MSHARMTEQSSHEGPGLAGPMGGSPMPIANE